MYIYKKFALLVALIFLCSIMSSCEYPVFTQNISDYNTPQYPIGDRFFLDKIPDNADTIAFSFYEYRHEDFDLYLELKFKTLEEMEEYLKTLKNHVTNTSNLKNDESVFLQVENPYDPSFVELFLTENLIYSGDKCYFGYKNEIDAKYSYLKCYFSVISYCLNNLTVIQSSTSGTFDYENKYLPLYFERFDISLDESFERFYYINK